MYKYMERCRQLETEKLKQLNDLIEEKKQDKEECQRQMERNIITDKEAG